MRGNSLFKKLDGVLDPFNENFNSDSSWSQLLSKEVEVGREKERKRWTTETLPLLARPEIGLHVSVQKRMLQLLDRLSDKDKAEAVRQLADQRRRLVTDAILTAANLDRRPPPEGAESEEKVEELIERFEERHRRTYRGDHSAWCDVVEEPFRKSGSKL